MISSFWNMKKKKKKKKVLYKIQFYHKKKQSLQMRNPPPPLNECPRYDSKKSDGEALLMLKLGGMWSTLLLPSLPGPLWLGVVAPDRVLSMSQIELFDI